MSDRRAQRRRSARARERLVFSAGLKVEAVGKYHVPETSFPQQRPGEHLWNYLAVFGVRNPTAERVDLDLENLITIEGPGCFWCEQRWTPELAALPCGAPPREVEHA